MNWEIYKFKLQLAVLGECENCSMFEKYLVAMVGWNRYFNMKKYRFNDLETDFLGYSRKIIIDNDLTRNAFIDSGIAVERAFIERELSDYKDLYIFNLSGEKPKSFFKVEAVKFKDCKHTFFKIID